MIRRIGNHIALGALLAFIGLTAAPAALAAMSGLVR